jgi:tetratricopeptide (TPR) repeat protein
MTCVAALLAAGCSQACGSEGPTWRSTSGIPDPQPTDLTSADLPDGQLEEIIDRSAEAMDRSDPVGAEKWAREALRLAPGDSGAWLHWCIFSYDNTDFAESERACTITIGLMGPVPEYHALLNRGLARVKLGKLEGAEADFQRCKRQEPHNAEAWYDESWVWAARGKRDRTILNLRNAGKYDTYYAMREVVASDEAFDKFGGDPVWEAFVAELPDVPFERRVPGLHLIRPIPGVPLSEEKPFEPDGGPR